MAVASVSESECFGAWGTVGHAACSLFRCCNNWLVQACTVCKYPSVHRTGKKKAQKDIADIHNFGVVSGWWVLWVTFCQTFYLLV